MIRRALSPLVPIYAAAISAKNAAYDRGWTKALRLPWPVVSIGNISVGGSGKTPFVICLTKLLIRHGMLVDVLSRGYGRNSNAIERVDLAGAVEQFGDEPLLIAQSTGAPVYVGASRYEAGLLVEKSEMGSRIHLLDDGFQHRKLARDLDIVLVHRSDFSEMLLPAGNLREPLSALKRSSVIVLREDDSYLEAQLRQRGIEASIWRIRRVVNVPQNAGRAVVFCGIARPTEFFPSVRKSGIDVVEEWAFPDHHWYSDEDVLQLVQSARSGEADCFLTTEKDFVRLSPEQKERFNAVAPLNVVKLEVQLTDETNVLDAFAEVQRKAQIRK